MEISTEIVFSLDILGHVEKFLQSDIFGLSARTDLKLDLNTIYNHRYFRSCRKSSAVRYFRTLGED